MKVLYATDGSEAAFAAKNVLLKLFRRDKTKIRAVSVTHAWSLDPDHIAFQLDPISERRGDSHEIVDAAAAELVEAGFDVKTVVLEGAPGHELVKYAKSGFDLVLVGAGSHSWLGTRLLGSVSTYVLHEAPCSVAVAHEAITPDGRGRVLVGVDGSNISDETVRMMASGLDPDRCDIAVLSVVPYQTPPITPVLMGPVVTDRKTMERVDEQLVRQAEDHVHRAAAVFQEAGFHTTARVEHGGPATVLLEEAKQIDADAIAVGSRGLGPIRRALLGSVSDQIARHAGVALVGRFYLNPEFDHEEVE